MYTQEGCETYMKSLKDTGNSKPILETTGFSVISADDQVFVDEVYVQELIRDMTDEQLIYINKVVNELMQSSFSY